MEATDDLLSWIELDAAALAGNAAQFRALVGPGVRLAAVVKANAYGHGLAEIVPLAAAAGVDWFAVHSLTEARAVRALDASRPVLILGAVAPGDVAQAVAAASG